MFSCLAQTKVNYTSPLFWAIIVGWILSVTLHEFAHGLVAYLGGDYTIRQRGGLTLNPLQYADPMMTFVVPLLFVLLGGIPLVGAATFVNTSLLRNRAWRSAVAIAGPLTNILLFVLCTIPLRSRFGWLDPYADGQWSQVQLFCGAMAVLQLWAALINLLPIPPLDGFHVIDPYLPAQIREGARRSPFNLIFLVVLFFAFDSSVAMNVFIATFEGVCNLLRISRDVQAFMLKAYDIALFGG